MVTKALAVLNKYFSSKMDMFKCAVQAQARAEFNFLGKFLYARTTILFGMLQVFKSYMYFLKVLITQDSCRVHREVLKFMPILRRLTKAKLNDDQVRTVSDVLEALTSFCHVPYDPEERHPMNQSILINHGTCRTRFVPESPAYHNASLFRMIFVCMNALLFVALSNF